MFYYFPAGVVLTDQNGAVHLPMWGWTHQKKLARQILDAVNRQGVQMDDSARGLLTSRSGNSRSNES
jgi:DNA polymerase III delta subunit